MADLSIAITYTRNDVVEYIEAASEYTSRSVLPYLNTYFQVSKLPKNAMLYGAASVSYNHNNASGTYTLDTPILNDSVIISDFPRSTQPVIFML